MATDARRIALITGASSGIGREFAVQLARDGHDLVLVSRDASRLRALAAELTTRYQCRCEVLVADLANDADTARVVARIDAEPIDLLVNNAGFGTRGSMARTAREGQETMIRVHVLAAHRLAHAAVQSMVPRGHGAIINVASTASFLTSPGNVNYTATKAWQRVFAESLALEVRSKGIYVQALCPGYTRTEFHDRASMDMSRHPAWLWMTAERVVAESLRALQRRRPVVVIPGAGYRIAVVAVRLMPPWLWRAIVSRRRRTTATGG